MIRNIAFLLSLLWVTGLFAQISTNEAPISNLQPIGDQSTIPVVEMPAINVQKLIAEDKEEEQKGVPPRFGKDFTVNLNLDNAGVWHTYPNGDQLWRLTIVAKDARSINFLYDDFYLPAGAKLFIYNADQSHQLGAFTEQNNKIDRRFGTGLVYGDEVTLEYFEPAAVSGQGAISINKVVHGYRYIQLPDQAATNKAFGDSGSCNFNTICSQGNNWRTEMKGVALMILSGTRWCSGSLINNLDNDDTPYFLTANHCLSNFDAINNPNASAFSFYWNYDSPSCGHNQADGPTNFSTVGATVVANNGNPGDVFQSDFALLRLIESPVTAGYDVYFNGFDAKNTNSSSVTGIHHPAGDVKKISMANGSTHSTSYYGNRSNSTRTHWRVLDWTSGTTEPGSSGSPLFDNATKRIIGDLSGGDAACGNDDPDWYGKVWWSWNQNTSDARRRLKEWLDPNNTGMTAVDGKEPGNALAVEWVDFKVQAQTDAIALNWNIANATNNAGFDILKSTDGQAFMAVHSVPAQTKNSTTTETYQYLDRDVKTGVRYYYQIVQRDVDGATSSTKIQSIILENNATEWSVYPNPIQNQLQLQSPNVEYTTLQLEVHNALGQEIHQKQLTDFTQNIVIETNRWQAGIYFVQLIDNQQIIQRMQIIKQ